MAVEHTTNSQIAASIGRSAGEPNRWRLFWQTVTKFERRKIIPWIALRNALAVGVPLLIGVLGGATLSGVAIATGALNVSYSDGEDPYSRRARRMLASSLLTAAAVFIGGMVGRYHVAATVIAAMWAFAAGLVVALGSTAADLGVLSLVVLVVYSAQPLSPQNAGWATLLALGGGLLQTAFALVLWPVQRYKPERQALGQLYLELARAATDDISAEHAPPGSQASTQAQETLAALGRDNKVEGDRYRSLLSQAERIRLCLLMLARLQRRLAREQNGEQPSMLLRRFCEVTGDLLYTVGLSLTTDESVGMSRDDLTRITAIAEELRAVPREEAHSFYRALLEDAQLQCDALSGQLRAAIDLAENSSPAGSVDFDRRESLRPSSLRLAGALAILRANLTLRSTAWRHAVRLAACLAAGDVIGRMLDWRRSYWLPMTIAIVLKPDFTATFSRGILRLAGTFAGLTLATLIFYFLNPSVLLQVVFVTLFTFLLRCVGPANYGIFVSSVSALIVLLVGLAGVSAWQVIPARAVNTAAGGLLALIAYWVWPTWEKEQVREVFARMLDGYRAYFRGIAEAYRSDTEGVAAALDSLRLDSRLARSNAEASIERLGAEPHVSLAQLGLYRSMLASSHRLVHALMALESGLVRSRPVPAREAFRMFEKDVDLTFYFLSAALRGAPLLRRQLPDLREDHRRLVHSGDPLTERYALVNIETDRLTNSLNTLSGQVLRLLAGPSGATDFDGGGNANAAATENLG